MPSARTAVAVVAIAMLSTSVGAAEHPSVPLGHPQPVVMPPGPIPIPCPPPPCEPVLPCPPHAVACPAVVPCPAPTGSRKVEVVFQQPEVRVVSTRPGSTTGGKPAAQPANYASKTCSLFNINLYRNRSKLVGGQAPVTSVIPAYATATIPIAFQTTTFGRQEAAFSRADLESLVRDLVRRDAGRRGSGESAPESGFDKDDCCAELKQRLDRVEKRLEAIEKQVERIAQQVK